MAKEFSYEIVEKYGVISEDDKYAKELNLISYNGAKPKIDIRTWTKTDDEYRMGKGITLTYQEAMKLKELLDQIEEE